LFYLSLSALSLRRFRFFRLTRCRSDEKISAAAIRYGNAYLYCDLSLYYLLGVLYVLRNSLQGIEKSLFPPVAGVDELIERTVLCLLFPAALLFGAFKYIFKAKQNKRPHI